MLLAISILFLIPIEVQAFETIYLEASRIEIKRNDIDLKTIKRLDFEKLQPIRIYHRNGFDVLITEYTEIPIDELATKKGIAKLIPALISAGLNMYTLKLYDGQRDKALHHTFTYVVTRLTDKPFKTAATVSIGKELGYDLLLGLGDPDWNDVAANIIGTLQAKIVKNEQKHKIFAKQEL